MLASLALALAIGGDTSERTIAPPPRVKNIRPIVRPTDYIGEVMGVTKDSITIRGRDSCDRDGPEVIRIFKADAHLAKVEQHPQYTANWNYRIPDVKVGDKVNTILRASGDDDLCLTIRILRRPGGLVPPAPFESAEVPHKYHNDANAYQAFEERGVPLPLRLDEDYQRKLEEAIQREHAAFRKRRDHTAPPPRPVVRK